MNDNIIMYNEPVLKTYTTVQPGDIIETEYGDYDNWVQVIVDKVEKTDTSIKTTGVYLNNRTEKFEGYNMGRIATFKVIGKLTN